MPTNAFRLRALSGLDVGTCFDVSGEARTLGRGRDAELALRDLRVSRRHAVVRATPGGVHFEAIEGTGGLVAGDGRRVEALEARAGDELTVGGTRLVVEEIAGDGRATPHGDAPEILDAKTLLTGASQDVRGLAGVFALVEALDRAADPAALEAHLAEWARAHVEAASASVVLDADDGEPALRSRPNDLVVRSDEDGTWGTVPAHGAVPRWIRFRFPADGAALGDATRRLLIVAGRVCGSRLGQLGTQRAREEDRVALRRLAVGSAREFVGESAAAEQIARLVPRLAASTSTVLVVGETGTGKSFVARLIHEASARAAEPLRVVNCAAIPESLIETELFGHERGAFTGAVAARAGALESAGAGTLFLDEIGELPLASQAKLLRVLEERRFERIGSNKPIPLRARVIAATNRDLEEMVRRGGFRSDLYFRVSVVKVRVAPLRERAADVPLLARLVLADLAPSAGRRIEGIAPDALEALQRYSWPGNVRELRNAIEHALVMGDDPWLRACDLPEVLAAAAAAAPRQDGPAPGDGDPFVVQLPADLEWLERRSIEAALARTNGNRTKAAAILGVTRQTLYNKLGAPGSH
jgi:DNA-binding NtrC family response regulator